ncbi:ppsA [Symbiodinium sp. CCMP2456]|nr:ppsA [Symbiodinium sp. CCMP2456]
MASTFMTSFSRGFGGTNVSVVSYAAKEEARELYHTAEQDAVTQVERILQKPADPNFRDHREFIAVHGAADNGAIASARLLLEVGR